MRVSDAASKAAVFAHYLVGSITEEHAHKDVVDAHALGFDALALNIGDPGAQFVDDALSYMFAKAEEVGLKLFISMDVSASGCYGATAYNYAGSIHQYQNSTAYLKGPNGYPFLSTFSDGGWTADEWNNFTSTVMNNQSYFVPDFDGTEGYYQNAEGWWDYWGGVADGFFSWESAWPLRNGRGGLYPGDVSPDVTVMEGTKAHNKSYMISLSTLQYKDAYNTNLYRSGELNMPVRMANILKMDPRPDFVEVITWNDGPEAHYIGNLFPEQNSDFWPAKYTGPSWPHSGWQALFASFIKAFKSGETSASAMAPPFGEVAIGSIWYHPILTTAICINGTAGTPPNYTAPTDPTLKCTSYPPPNSYYEVKPDGFGNATDTLNWAVVMAPWAYGFKVRALSNGRVLDTTPVKPGLNYHSSFGVGAGHQTIELVDPLGLTIMTSGVNARPIAKGCPTGTYNLNYVVDDLTPAFGITLPLAKDR